MLCLSSNEVRLHWPSTVVEYNQQTMAVDDSALGQVTAGQVMGHKAAYSTQDDLPNTGSMESYWNQRGQDNSKIIGLSGNLMDGEDEGSTIGIINIQQSNFS